MSKHYAKVKRYYDKGYWTENMVKVAVKHWITAEEFKKITGEEYTK